MRPCPGVQARRPATIASSHPECHPECAARAQWWITHVASCRLILRSWGTYFNSHAQVFVAGGITSVLADVVSCLLAIGQDTIHQDCNVDAHIRSFPKSKWSRWQDLNLRSPAPKAGGLSQTFLHRVNYSITNVLGILQHMHSNILPAHPHQSGHVLPLWDSLAAWTHSSLSLSLIHI